MSARTLALSENLYAYTHDNWLREAAPLRRLREETRLMPMGGMQISPEQGQLMGLLAGLIGARRYLEIGCLTGYSAMAVALALPPDGKVVTCDISETYTAVARTHWDEAGLAGRIELRLGPALETLDGLIADRVEAFDFAFIDADKENYEGYFERALALLRPGGLIGIDNVLWQGKVADPSVKDSETTALRALNARLKRDERVDLALVPIGDGLTLARKR